MKNLVFIRQQDIGHWVGDGFPVRSLFSYHDLGSELSPFLLLDYAGPMDFPAAGDGHRRGVGEHPHRGFETVTIVYSGEVQHRDSTGAGGIIGPGDVQWMTAGAGIVHEEYHGPRFAREGGRFEMIQLWVNLPAAHKMTAPGYQGITDAQIPRVELPDGAGTARIIAGRLGDTKGPARTFTPINLWDLRLKGGHEVVLDVPEGHTAAAVVLAGQVRVDGGEPAGEARLVVLRREGAGVAFTALQDTTLLMMSGAPLDEPIVGQGPFVMNTAQEIREAIADYTSGRMGRVGTADT